METGHARPKGIASRRSSGGRTGTADSRRRSGSAGRSPGESDARRPSTGGPARSSSPAPAARRPSTGPARSSSPAPARHRLVEPQDVTQVFKRFDTNGDGHIDRNEMAEVLRQLDPERWTNRNATILLMAVDSNFDGKIDYEEFVAWVGSAGGEQDEFRIATGMPRSRAELAKLEKERKELAARGTVAELNTNKALAAHRSEVWKNAVGRKNEAHERYERLKEKAESASEIFMPAYERFKVASADMSVPAKEVLEHDIKAVLEIVEVEEEDAPSPSAAPNPPPESSPPIGVRLVAQAMCALFKVHPGTRAKLEPDYWEAFLNAVLAPNLMTKIEKFDKEHIPDGSAMVIKQLCEDQRFDAHKVMADSFKMGRSSNFIVYMCLWVHFLDRYHQAGVKKMWDQVTQAEIEMRREEVDAGNKENLYNDVRRTVKRLEADLNSRA